METYLKTQLTETEGGTMGDLFEDTAYRDRGWHYGRPTRRQFTEIEGGTTGEWETN